jgi:hypothetical protein
MLAHLRADKTDLYLLRYVHSPSYYSVRDYGNILWETLWKYYFKVTKTQNARISIYINILREKLRKYYYQQIPLAGYLSITTTLYNTVLCVNHYSVRSLFVQSLFVATTTPCNCAACHPYEQYKKSFFTILSITMILINMLYIQ